MRSCTILALLLAVVVPAAGASAQDAPDISILSAGEGHREPLRHRFEAGQTQAMRLRVQSQMRTLLGDQEQTIPMPIMRMDMTFGPTRITETGNLRYPYEIIDVGVTGGDNENLNQRVLASITQLIGTHGETEIDDRGNMVDFTYELPEGAPEGLQQQERLLRDSMSQVLPRFPTEPVAEGARWVVRSDLNLPNMQVPVATTYELRSRSGDHIELHVSTDTVDDAPNPADIDVRGSGRIRFVLGTLETRGRVQTVAAARIRGPRGEMRMRIRTRMQITPR